jgi:hypothetical protein
MAFTVQESIVINRPRPDVWDYVVEHDDWRRPDVVQVRKLTEGSPGVGTQYEDTVQLMGREMTVVNEVTRFEPPAYMAWTQADREGPTYTEEGSYALESVPGGTKFTLSGEYQASGLWRLAVPLIRRRLQNEMFPRFLRQLKETLEKP